MRVRGGDLTLAATARPGLTLRRAVVFAAGALACALTAPAPVSAATPPPLAPKADAWVDASRPGRNLGGGTRLAVDARPAAKTLVRFEVPGDRVLEAKLYLYSDSAGRTIRVRRAGNAWTERGVTWRNAPAVASRLAASTVTKIGWTVVDVTPLAVPGPVSFVVTTPSRRATLFRSREAPRGPRLVVRVNHAPECSPASFETEEDTALEGGVVCADADGDPLTYSAAGGPVVVQPAGGFVFTPPVDVAGTLEFRYRASDAKNVSEPAVATVEVRPVNDPPRATAQSSTIAEDGAKAIALTGEDVDGDPVTLAITRLPAAGVLSVGAEPGGHEILATELPYTLVGTNQVTFEPDPNFTGSDSFAFTAADAESESLPATVSLDVTPVNDAPAATADAFTTSEDAWAEHDVLVNDSDLDGDSLSVTTPQPRAANGTVDCTPEGLCTYNPNFNFNGTDSFGYEVSDGQGGTATATASVTVAPVNDPPVARSDTRETSEDTPLVLAASELLANDSAGPPNETSSQTLAVTAVGTDAGTRGTVALVDGTITYVPGPDFNGHDHVTYTLSDSSGATDTGTLNVEVEPVNDAPAARRDVERVSQNGEVVMDVLANDSAGPPNESGEVVVLMTVVGAPAHGVAVLEGERIRYTPTAGFAGSDSFAYRVCDSGFPSACDETTVEVSVGPVAATLETPPVAGADDAAVWADPDDPAGSLLVAADHEYGIRVYDMAGTVLDSRTFEGRFNNVDLRDGFRFGDTAGPLVAASGRDIRSVRPYRLDPATRLLRVLGADPIQSSFGSDNPALQQQGICLYRSSESGRLYVFVTRALFGATTPLGQFDVEQWELTWDATEEKVAGQLVRSLRLERQSEGCVADDELGYVYIAEENEAVWKLDAEPDGGAAMTAVDRAGRDGRLRTDIGGVALVRGRAGTGHLIVSDQGGGAYRVYRREGANDYVRTFTTTDGEVDAIDSTDGLEATSANLGPAFADGALVAQDEPADSPESLKLVPLERILETGSLAENGSCGRPYVDQSPWNTRLGAAPAYDPGFPPPLAALVGELSSDPKQFTFPVYEVSAATPRVPVALDGWFSNVVADGRTLENLKGRIFLPIPAGAEPAAGSDAQIVLVDPLTGDEWGVSNLRRDADGNWKGWNAYHYNVRWSGVPPADAGGRPFFPRGAGVPYLAGLVRPCEIARGAVEHALAFAYDSPTDEFVYPATKSDGISPHRGIDLPEGTRLQLDPALDPAELPGCTQACRTIARALQEYGMIVIDNSGREKVMAEYQGTAAWPDGVLTAATVNPIPLSAFRVIAQEP